MQDLRLHELGARRVHWRYDDPSGLPDAPVRAGGLPVRAAGELRRTRRDTTPKTI